MSNGGGVEGVTVRKATNILNIPDEELHELIDSARELIEKGEARNWKAVYKERQTKGLVGEYKALRRALHHLFPGSKAVFVPSRRNGVDILDVLIRKSDGSFVVIEAKFQTDGGKIRYGRTNGIIFKADEAGNVRPFKVRRANAQLSRKWIEARVEEIRDAAKRLPDAEAKHARRLARDLRRALDSQKLEALGIVVDKRGHVVFEDNRTAELYRHLREHGEVDKGTSKSNKSTSGGDKGTATRGKPDDAPGPSGTSSGAEPRGKATRSAGKPASVRTRTGRLAVKFDKITKFKPGFTGNVILEAAKIALFGVLQSKLEKVNRDVIRRLYASKVYKPHIHPHVQNAIEGAKSGKWYEENPGFDRRWVYIFHRYEVRMRQQAETASDAVVIIFSGFEIPETVESLDALTPDDLYYYSRKEALRKTHVVGKRRETGERNVVAYNHQRFTLVHSPFVHQLWESLDGVRDRSIDKLNRLSALMTSDGHGEWIRKGGELVAESINEFAFAQAAYAVSVAASLLPKYERPLESLGAELTLGDVLVRNSSRALGFDGRALLTAYLGADPFASRKRFEKAKEEVRRQQMRQRVPPRLPFSRIML